MNGQTRLEYLRHSADRSRLAWRLRQQGEVYAAIGAAIGVSKAQASRVIELAEARMERASHVYNRAVLDPIVYGVWHTFTHEGRALIACARVHGFRDHKGPSDG